MNILQRCYPIFKVDIVRLKDIVSSFSENQWSFWNHRQNEYDVHSQTKTYPLLWTEDLGEKPIYFNDELLLSEVVPIVKRLESFYNGKVANILLSNLYPHAEIPLHMDTKKLLKMVHRCHLPIKTNKEVLFHIDGYVFNLEEELFVEINNTKIHGVKNNSNQNRIHLIVDILPN